jgi:hypothetical protein
MIYRRERPRCRKVILQLMKEYNCTLEELLHHPQIFLSPGLKKQCRKMLQEKSLRVD